MTAYNAGATIQSSIASIQQQDFMDLNIVVVDDGSTDDTLAKLESLATQDSRLTLVRQSNQGIVSAANHGLTYCRAEFVARLDADDIALKDRIGRQVEVMERNPKCVAVSGLAYHIDAKGRRLGSLAGAMDIRKVDPFWIPAIEPYIMHPFVLIRKKALDVVGGYRHVDFAEDTDLYWRLLQHGELCVIDQPVGEYRVHAASVTSRSIVNGRISAINSQLSAISEQRRRMNQQDLQFSAQDVSRWREMRTLEAILADASQRLTEEETPRYRLAVVAKLLELNSYRPYHLEASDCRTMHAILLKNRHAIFAQYPAVRRLWGSACARLLGSGFLSRTVMLYHFGIEIGFLRSLLKQIVRRWVPRAITSRYRAIKASLVTPR